jgi:hypothetical protein
VKQAHLATEARSHLEPNHRFPHGAHAPSSGKTFPTLPGTGTGTGTHGHGHGHGHAYGGNTGLPGSGQPTAPSACAVQRLSPIFGRERRGQRDAGQHDVSPGIVQQYARIASAPAAL